MKLMLGMETIRARGVVRAAADFGDAHVPGSMNIGLGGQFAMWAGSLMSLSAAIV